MLRRLIGLSMLTVIIMPLFLAGLLIFSARGIALQLQTIITPRVTTIENRLEDMNDSLATVQTAANRIATSLNTFTSDINTLAILVRDTLNFRIEVPLPDIPDIQITIPVINQRITIPLPNLADLNLEIPGLRQVRGFFADVFGFFRRIGSTLTDLAEVQSVTQDLSAVVLEVQQLGTEVTDVVEQQANTFILIFSLCIIWVLLIYLIMVYRWLSEGWKLLTGQ